MVGSCVLQSHRALGARVGSPKEHLTGRPLLLAEAIHTTPVYSYRRRPCLKRATAAADQNPEGKRAFAQKAPSQNIVASPSAAAKGVAKVRPAKAVATAPPATEAASPPPTPATKTVTLTISTGNENNAGMYDDARVSFVSADGRLDPPPDGKDKTGHVFPGPFRNGKPANHMFTLPYDFEVAGVIVDNPKATRPDRKFLGWVADRLDVDVPVIGVNLLLAATKLTKSNRITNGDWYVRQLELTGPKGDKQTFPLYGWIEESTQRIAFDGTPYLPQKTPPGLIKWRRGNLLNNQNAYNYQPYNDLSKPPTNKDFWSPNHRRTLDPYPQHLAEDREGPRAGKIPKDEQFGLSKRTDFDVKTIQGLANLLSALLYDRSILFTILGCAGLGAVGGVAIGWLAEKGVTEEFLNTVDEFLNGLVPPGPLKAVLGGVPELILLTVLANQFFPGQEISGAVLGAVIGAFAGNYGSEVAGLLAGLVGFVATLVVFLKLAPPLAYKSVDAYAQACYGHNWELGSVKIGNLKLGPLKIGYLEPFVYKLDKADPKINKPADPTKAWDTDFMFGWQTVAGINPESITLVTSEDTLLATKTITEKDLDAVKKEVPNFDEELRNKKIYMLDYSVLESFREEFNKKYDESGKTATKYLYAPVVILHQNDSQHDKVPIPIAIKLCQDADQTIITPGMDKSKDKWGWKAAKAIAASANSGVHQLVQHFLRTHAVCETYAIAMRRQLSEVHPLFKLLINHTRYTMDINNRARASLINTDGVIESTFSPGPQAMAVSAAGYENWRFAEQNPRTDLKVRGVDKDTGALPNYPYREHALEVFKALEEYVKDYVSLYYKKEEDIANDFELQNFWVDVKRGAQSLDTWLKTKKNPKGLLWPELKTSEDLVNILATIIWSGSAMHAIVNFGQYDYAGFVPNSPASIRSKFHFDKLASGEYTEELFMKSMPVATEMTNVMTVVEALVDHSVEEQYLGFAETTGPGKEYADDWFTDPEAKRVYEKFIERISTAQKSLVKLNSTAKIPYYYLLPNPAPANYPENIPAQGVPNSVTI